MTTEGRAFMRAMGPGSVSSILKTALDVVFFALIVGAAAILILTVAGLVLRGEQLRASGVFGAASNPMVIGGGLALALLALGGLLVITQSLRRVFATLTIGEPFHLDNVRRLRIIGFALLALELLSYAARAFAASMLPDQVERIDYWPNFTAWFAVLVVFVLAEVFREGARLRREAELTI